MSHHPVIVTVTLRVKEGMEARARAALHEALAPTRLEPGCLLYELHESRTDPRTFLFYEQWIDGDALAAHSQATQPHRLKLREDLGVLLDGPPQLTTWRQV